MKKFIALSLLGLTVVGSASAMQATGTVWRCNPAANNGNKSGFQWCQTTVTSGTTATGLGTINVLPNQSIIMTFGVSGSAVANLVTPTVSYYVGNKVVATQNVSVSTAGNVVIPSMAISGIPAFTAMSVSTAVPSTISSTNGIPVSIQQNDK